ncbi:bMERB domain-containing protein 1-like isoform X3 [Nerophis ophidion]|uniref:bMERB domain-containing protein 1-like isoform X3 n=1 Tax=Nerophis ophidion TaxID=159077 RepID=UPI002AE0A585|nr:bMERB domain-containing protein 1-like isoform X3 [Nerophis ophidion]
MMEMKRESFHQYGSLERTPWSRDNNKAEDDVVSMADSSLTADDIEGELFKIERIRDVLVRRESELRYMMDDIQLCKEITRLKKELHKLVSLPDKDKSNEDRQKEEELLQQIHKLVETRDFLVDDVEFERLRCANKASRTQGPAELLSLRQNGPHPAEGVLRLHVLRHVASLLASLNVRI